MHQVLSVSMQQRQQLVMTPAMVQAIRLLQLNSMELEQEVIQEMEENPFLEMVEEEEEATSEDAAPPASEGDGDIERVPDTVLLDSATPESKLTEHEGLESPLDFIEKPDRTEDVDPSLEDYYQEAYDDSIYATAEAQGDTLDFSQMDGADATLYDHLLRQLHVTDLDGVDLEIAEFLIGNIDSNGYLKNHLAEERLPEVSAPAAEELSEEDEEMLIVGAEEVAEIEAARRGEPPLDNGNGSHGPEAAAAPAEPVQDILDVAAEKFDVGRSRVEEVLEIIQEFDPPGVGARSIQECLLIQLRAAAEPDEQLVTLVRDHFQDLARRRLKVISRAMKIPEKRVAELCQRIATLEPKPGRAIGGDRPQYITPDVVVSKIDGKYYISLNEGRTDHLKISSYYRQRFQSMLAGGKRDRDAPENPEADYIRKKYSDAVVLIRNIERRKGTIMKIAAAIMEKQTEFLEKGIEHLRPMTLKDIAAEVGMHEATVSRVTANKYVETPRGTFPLKHFFSSGLESDTGESQSSRAIRNQIKEMIEAEDPRHPLSDQRIADLLREKGTRIARRTVTKYREQMKILPTNMRRQS
ncbi:MAG: RNA polymerase factor sigma-54 [Candidatus Sumerlaeia bacterium]|nr:RNA polymerase factor sigma-54 [Candidatus Sumerlaeia bacterium]